MALVDYKGQRIVEPGRFSVAVGGRQPLHSETHHRDVLVSQFRVEGDKVKTEFVYNDGPSVSAQYWTWCIRPACGASPRFLKVLGSTTQDMIQLQEHSSWGLCSLYGPLGFLLKPKPRYQFPQLFGHST